MGGSDTDPIGQAVGVGEHRRNSAPELAEQWRQPDETQSLPFPISLPKQVQRLTQPQLQSQQLEVEPCPEQGDLQIALTQAPHPAAHFRQT